MVKRIAAHLGVFFGLLALLWLTLSASAMIPNSALQENYERSAQHYGRVDAFHFHDGGKRNAVADNYADSILLNIAWHMGNGSSPFAASIETDYFDGGALGENTGLLQSVTEGAEPNTDYTRYWHGNAMFARLLHLFTDVNGMKAIGFATALVLASLVVVALARRGHADLAALLVVSLAAVHMWNISLSLEYQAAFIVALLMCLLFLLLEREGDEWLPVLSTAAGVIVAFFDFLTTETLSILLPLILVVAVRAKEGRLAAFRESAVLLVKCGLCWLAAYAGAFVVKWAAASLVTGENEFALALSSASLRVGVSTELAAVESTGPLAGLVANFATLFGGAGRVQPLRALAGVAVMLGALAVAWRLLASKEPQRDAAVLVLILGAMVLLRFLVLGSHSFRHDFFTYRALAATILALLVALRLNVSLPRAGVGR